MPDERPETWGQIRGQRPLVTVDWFFSCGVGASGCGLRQRINWRRRSHDTDTAYLLAFHCQCILDYYYCQLRSLHCIHLSCILGKITWRLLTLLLLLSIPSTVNCIHCILHTAFLETGWKILHTCLLMCHHHNHRKCHHFYIHNPQTYTHTRKYYLQKCWYISLSQNISPPISLSEYGDMTYPHMFISEDIKQL